MKSGRAFLKYAKAVARHIRQRQGKHVLNERHSRDVAIALLLCMNKIIVNTFYSIECLTVKMERLAVW